MHYQWYRGANSISGKTTSSLVLTNIQCDQADYYSVVVHAGNCTQTANYQGYLTVYNTAPSTATGMLFTAWQKTTITFNVASPNPSGNRIVTAVECPYPGTTTNAQAISYYNSLGWGPNNGSSYTANSTYSTTGSNYYNPVCVVFNGTGTSSITVSGLTKDHFYAFAVYNYIPTNTTSCVTPFYSSAYVRAQKTSPKESDEDLFTVQVSDNFALSDVAPNPAYSDINFALTTQEKLPFTIEIYSIEGMQVYTQQMDVNAGTTPLSISLKSEKGTLPGGMYILKVRTGTDELTRRFIYMP
jgi:hypothetical protein